MTIVHLARHGETTWHAENRYAGTSDVALNDHGLAQANLLATWASAERIDALACSALSRAVATMRPIERATSLTAHVDSDFREIHFGVGEGMSAAEMAIAFPSERAAFERSPASRPLPSGESGTTAVRRFRRALDRAVSLAAPEATLLVVAHSTIIRLLLCHEFDLPLDDYRRRFPRLDNVAITTIRLVPGAQTALLAFNMPIHQLSE